MASTTTDPAPTTVTDRAAPPADRTAAEVVVIGGGPAGLSAATVLGRSRRSVLVIDSGQPRNAPADGVHAFLGHDGTPPSELLARGRAEVEHYGGQLVGGTATAARLDGDGVVIELADGTTRRGRHVVVTTGLVDELPQVAGLREQWGRGVIHCPYCHGWEVRDRRVVVLATSPMGMHQAELFSQLTDDLAVIVHEPGALDRTHLDRLHAMGADVVEGKAIEVRSVDGVLADVVVEGAGVV
ncbi:MAG: FAD-dependent oxidoreductase, partial [Phycicoccus sp.]